MIFVSQDEKMGPLKNFLVSMRVKPVNTKSPAVNNVNTKPLSCYFQTISKNLNKAVHAKQSNIKPKQVILPTIHFNISINYDLM